MNILRSGIILLLLMVMVLEAPVSSNAASYHQSSSITPKNASQIQVLRTFAYDETRDIRGLSWSLDGSILAVAGSIRLKLYQPHSQSPSETLYTGNVDDLAFSPTEKLLGFVSSGEIHLYDLVSNIERTLQHSSSLHITFSPDGKLIASGGGDGTLLIWNVQTSILLRTINTGDDNAVYDVRFNPDSSLLMYMNIRGGINLVSVASILDSKNANPEVTNVINQPGLAVFGADGKSITTSITRFGEKQSSVQLWSISNSNNQLRVQSSLVQGSESIGIVYDLTLNPDGSLIVLAGENGQIQIQAAITKTQLTTLTGHKHVVRYLAFDPTGTLLASAGDDGMINVWGLVE